MKRFLISVAVTGVVAGSSLAFGSEVTHAMARKIRSSWNGRKQKKASRDSTPKD